jgi:nucleoid-associated protein YgaU
MTRELKLAMVIGFALMLLLAILVSDHFSIGDTDHSTLVASAQPRLADTAPPVALRRTTGEGSTLPSPPRAAPSSQDPPLAATASRPLRVRPVGDDRPSAPAVRSPSTPIAAASTAESAATARPSPQTYRVAEGDSLSSIATAFYGDAGLWQRLAEANRERLPNPDRMRVGLLLVIPDRQALDGSAVPAPGPGPGPAAVRDPLVAAEPRIHVVGEGETLSEIAAAHLGSARRWPEIVAANRDRIDDPDRVRPGTELRLP